MHLFSPIRTNTNAPRRDQPRKVYVQHLLKEHSRKVWELIHGEGAVFYLSGNAKNMPKEVRSAFKEIIVREGGLSEDEADKYIRTMELHDRFMTETWF